MYKFASLALSVSVAPLATIRLPSICKGPLVDINSNVPPCMVIEEEVLNEAVNDKVPPNTVRLELVE